jgi:hypothetical protein
VDAGTAPQSKETTMHVDHEIISSAADLITGAISSGLPVENEAESRGFDADQARTLEDLINELSWADLYSALEKAARRLQGPKSDDEEAATGGEG